MELLDLALYLFVGSLAGVLAGLLGVGGGVVIVPVLLWVFRSHGFDESIVVHLAIGTSLATIVATYVSSVRAHHRRGAILWRLVKMLVPGIVLGAWLGAAFAGQMSTAVLQRVFGGFVIFAALQTWFSLMPKDHHRAIGMAGMVGAGGVIGAISAVVGIGGGLLMVPFLNWSGINMRNAVATSTACGFPIAVSGAVGFVAAGWHQSYLPIGSTGYLYWPAALGISIASFLFAPLGAKLAHTLPVAILKRTFAVLLLLVGVKLLLG